MNASSTTDRQIASSWGGRIAKRALFVALAVLLICAGVLAYARFWMDGATVAALVVPRLESALGKRISYGSAELSWTSLCEARITAVDLEIRDSKRIPVMIRIPRLVVHLSLKSAWHGVISLNQIRVVRPVLRIDGLGESPGGAETNAVQRTRLGLFRFVLSNLTVTEGSVVMSRTTRSTPVDRVLLSNVQGSYIHGPETRDGRFKARGAVSEGHNKGLAEVWGKLDSTSLAHGSWQGSVRVQVMGCPLGVFRDLAPVVYASLPVAGGLVDLAVSVAGSPARFAGKGDLTIRNLMKFERGAQSRQPVADAIRARFAVDRLNRGLQIDLTEASLPGVSVSAEARLDKISAKDPSVTLAIRNADIELEKISPFIPPSMMNRADRERLFEAGLKGHLKITGAAWTGRLSELAGGFNLRGVLVLDAVLDKVSAFIPGLGAPISRASGSIRLSPDGLLFDGVSLSLGGSPIVLNGWITGLRKAPEANLFVSIDAQAQDLIPIIETKAVAARLEQWIGHVSESSGGMEVTLDVKGNLNNPTMKGRVKLRDFQCTVEGIPLPLKKLNGTIRFRQSGVIASNIEGLIGASPASLKGQITPDGADLRCEVQARAADLSRLMAIPPEIRVVRPILLSLTLKGPRASLAFSAAADLKNNGARYGSLVRKEPGTPLRIEATGSRQAGRMRVEEFYVSLGEARIAGRVTVEPGEAASVSLHLPPKGVRSEALIPFLHPALEVQPGGRIEGDAIVKVDERGRPSVEANLQLSHVSLRFPGFHKRTEGMDARIQLREQTLQLALTRAKIGSSLFSGSMTASGWIEPRVDISLEFSALDTQDFTAPPGYVGQVTWGEWIRSNPAIRFLARSRGTGFVQVRKGNASARQFSDFRAQIEGKSGLLKVTNWTFRIADGIIRGSALFDIRRETRIPLTLELQGDQLRMEKVMLSNPQWLRIEGSVIVDGQLQWKLNANRARDGVYKTGAVEVRVHNGVVNKFDVLSKFFTLFNLGSLVRGRLPDLVAQGLPFQSLTWKMDVFDTKWNFKNMLLISDAARINSWGIYLSDQDRIDFRVDVSPLVGFDTIFSGLFGNLITRNGKILTTTFRVSGLSGSPDIRLEPFENLKSMR